MVGIEAQRRARAWATRSELDWLEYSRFRCYQGWAMASRILTRRRSALNWVFADETMVTGSLSGEEATTMLLLRMDYCSKS